MPQNKEHWSLWLLHDLLLEMTNGLSCLLNFPCCWFAFALGPLRCKSLPLQSILRGPEQALTDGGKHCKTAADHLQCKRVFSFSLCPEDTVRQTSVEICPWKIYTEDTSIRKSSQDILFWNTNKTGCVRSAVSVHLLCASLHPLLCQKCFTLHYEHTHACTHTINTHWTGQVNEETVLQSLSVQFKLYVTVRYIQRSVQRQFLTL